MHSLSAAAAVALAAIASACSYTLPRIEEATLGEAESSEVIAADGTMITTFHGAENRESVPLLMVPVHVREAVIAVEDARFPMHHGVDLKAVLRALRTNAAAGEVEEGGSTITQQYVKLAVLEDADQTLERKVREAVLAIAFERNHSKEEILELYLNAVYFGNGAYGVQAAAEEYFDKPVGELTVAEGALLAALIQTPEELDPRENPHAAFARRNQVIDRMVEEGHLTSAQAKVAKRETLAVRVTETAKDERYPAPYFVTDVKRWALRDERLGPTPRARRRQVFAGGLRIETTLDLRIQRAAEEAVAHVLAGAPADLSAALVAIEPATGFVRAMVGGRDFFGASPQARYNLATQGGRQAGSAFKPLVLAAALEKGIPLTRSFSAPAGITLSLPTGERWRVQNYEGSGGGRADLVEATVRSYNTVYAQLVLEVGAPHAVQVASRLGIASPLDGYPSAVLGANDVTPLDMAAAFSTLANRGVRVPPVLVTRVLDRAGTPLFEHRPAPTRVLDLRVTDEVTGVLEQVIQRGTGRRAAILRPAAGKTGTAQEWRDAWFIGYTPDLAAAVWVGFPDAQRSMAPPATPIRVTGGTWPAQIWQRFMSAALAPLPPKPLRPGAPAAPAPTP